MKKKSISGKKHISFYLSSICFNRVFIMLLFLFYCTVYSMHGQNKIDKKISLNLENTTIIKALQDIKKQADISFVYNVSDINPSKRITINAKNESVESVLKKVLLDTDLVYTIKDNYIVLSIKGTNSPNTETTQPGKPSRQIKGQVVDKEKLPLIGVTVSVKNSTKGTMSDLDGYFELDVAPSDIVIVSYVGFVGQEIKVENQKELNITLLEDINVLDEVVVVGYGVQKKVNLTGAVSQVSAEDLKNRPVSNMTQLLQGVIPNLNITTSSGKPGEGGSLNIRGNTSLSSSGVPMVLIDGIPGDMDRINPNDIESVTVLKDASAGAIYGARAAFGVILVTTKSVKGGKTRVNYSNNFGWLTHSTKTDFINSGFWNGKINDIAMYNALGITSLGYSDSDYEELWARVNDKTEHPDRPWVVTKPNMSGKDMYNYYGNFDWFNYLYSDWRTKSNHNVNITGSSKDNDVRYMISGAYTQEEGVIKIAPDKYDRYNFRAKLDADVTKWLVISSNTSFFKSQYEWSGKADNFNEGTSVTTNPAYFYHPAYVPLNPDGTITGYTGKNNYQIGYGNHANWLNGKSKGTKPDSDFLTIFEAKAKIMNGLTLTANYAYGQILSEYQYRQVKVPYSLYPGQVDIWTLADLKYDKLSDAASNTKKQAVNIYGNYNKAFGDHSIQGTLGFNQEWQNYKIITGRGDDVLSEDLNDLNLVTNNITVNGGQESWAIRGAFMRFNYDYKGKYLAEFSGRYDGSSRFPKDKRFGFFPSFSVGWRLSEEKFMDIFSSTLNNLKLRYSYGSLGNQLTGNYGYIESMSTGMSSYLLDGDKSQYTSVPKPISTKYTWEKAITNNMGIDIGLFNSKLNIEADYYIRKTQGMLMAGPTLPAVYGASSPRQNAANLRTKGFEVSVSWADKTVLAQKVFSYNIKAVLSDYTAKVTKFNNPTKNLTDYYEGQQLGDIWGYRYGGIFQSDEEAAAWASIVNQDRINKRRVQAPTADLQRLQAGDIKIWDLDGDGDINTGLNTADNPGDMQIIGNKQPRYSYGVSLGANWNGIDMSVFIQGIGRRHWYPSGENIMFWQVYSRPYSSFIPTDFMKKVWTPENTDAYYPLLRGYIAQNSELSVANDMYLQDVSYCKLKNVVIGYSLPQNILRKTKFIDQFRVYVSGENLFTLTKLDSKYIDPESILDDSSGRTYPMNKIVSFGVEVTF